MATLEHKKPILPPYRIIRQITWASETKVCCDWLQNCDSNQPFVFFEELIMGVIT
jgi:hypothetical protein